MKLKFLGIAACALALCFTLVGCNSQKVTDFTWYQAAVPDKYELNTSLGSNAAKVSFAKTDEGKELRVNWLWKKNTDDYNLSNEEKDNLNR